MCERRRLKCFVSMSYEVLECSGREKQNVTLGEIGATRMRHVTGDI